MKIKVMTPENEVLWEVKDVKALLATPTFATENGLNVVPFDVTLYDGYARVHFKDVLLAKVDYESFAPSFYVTDEELSIAMVDRHARLKGVTEVHVYPYKETELIVQVFDGDWIKSVGSELV